MPMALIERPKINKQSVPNKIGIEGIGRLEAEIMDVIWDHRPVTVREVYEIMRLKKRIAYTTIMTVMNNLADKNLLDRDTSAIAHIYRPVLTREQVGLALIDVVVKKILNGDTTAVLRHLTG